jgi:hypothetical protein
MGELGMTAGGLGTLDEVAADPASSGSLFVVPPDRPACGSDETTLGGLSGSYQVGLQEEPVHRLIEAVAVLTHERRTGTGGRLLMAAHAQPNPARV